MTLTIILTTTGRPTLPDALDSLVRQDWSDGDEIMVVSDDRHDHVAGVVLAAGHPGCRHVAVEGGPHGDWGHTPRNRTMRLAGGTHVGHFDDDDVMLPGSVAQMRLDLSVDPDAVHLYRFVSYKDRQRVWSEPPRLAVDHVGTPNVVHPNKPETFGEWRPRVGGDGDFIVETCKRVGRHVWHPTVTCVVRPPSGYGVDRVCRWLDSGPRPRLAGSTHLARVIDARFGRRPWVAPAGCGVLTACDDAFFPGVQLLYHSLAGRCPLAVVDLGVGRRNAGWLAGRVHVVMPCGPAHRGRKAWQTWNKPWYFDRSPFEHALWLDADSVVSGSLVPLFWRLASNPVLTRHWDGDKYQGDIGPAVPAPGHPLPPGKSVNAGVVGLCPARDSALLDAWKAACLLAAKDPAVEAGFRWYDESALHWALREVGCWDAVVDEPGWNRLAWVRTRGGGRPPSSPQAFLTALPHRAGDEVVHYSVKEKPWTSWASRTHLWE